MSDGFLQGNETAPEITPEPVEAPVIESGEALEDAPLAADRAAFEQSVERKDEFLEAPAEDAPTTQVAADPGSAAPAEPEPAAPVDEVMVEVEKILEDGLGDYVETMPEEARQRFLSKGHEVSTQITIMVRGLKVELRRVVSLIRDWLLTIPGINRYFLEQEAKIKTDRIIALARVRKEDAERQV
ncbi:hypothetical protein IPH19_01945 [Candidatus Uhrbacteria bacterium]|nr:MAG: hypothetical protein IPH19_01945 [Candidatus Uhrbacteria bacterium]